MGRYQELYRIQNNLYTEGSPVCIEAGALLKDTVNNSIIAQLKIKNISLENIISCKVSIRAFENNGTELEGVDSFSYLDLKIGSQDSFGSKVPIVLPNEITRKITVAVTEVVFSDGETWSGNYNEWQTIPSQNYLNKEFEDSEILKQIKIEVGDKAKYKPLVDKGLFLCSCGSIHLLSNQVCSNCKNDFNNLISKIDYEYLNQQKDERLEREKIEKEKKIEQERIEQEKRLEQERIENIKREEVRLQREKKKKKTIIMAIIAVAIIIVAIIAVPIIKSMVTYKNAQKLMAAEQYDDAISIFTGLGDYKDSSDYLLEAKYLKASKWVSNDQFDEAINAYSELNGYKDSEEQIANCYEEKKRIIYEKAKQNITDGKLEIAIDELKTIEDYGDAENIIKSVAYDVAVVMYEKEQYESAINYLEMCDDNEQVKALLLDSKYKYVSCNFTDDDEKTVEYLDELVELQYLDSCDLFKKMNGWRIIGISVVGDSKKKDGAERAVKVLELRENGEKYESAEQITCCDKLAYIAITVEGGKKSPSIAKLKAELKNREGQWETEYVSASRNQSGYFEIWLGPGDSCNDSKTQNFELKIYDENDDCIYEGMI